ncbi:MAG: acetolactate decarboxylase [Verrucomicrobiota bacterium]|jgi:acetolactate decarboxylase
MTISNLLRVVSEALVLAWVASLPVEGQMLSIYPSIEVEFETVSGSYYQLESSPDLKTWNTEGDAFLGRGGLQSRFLRLGNGQLFYRARSVVPAPTVEEDCIFQHSTLGALSLGVYEGDLSFGELFQHGNHGLGTFQGVDGELVITNGKAYRVRVDGQAYEVDAAEQTPFAVITYFETDRTIELTAVSSFADFQQQVDAVLPSMNQLYAIRISGVFSQLTTRSVPLQTQPYPPLAEVVAGQTEFNFTEITGTMVGFRLPPYLSKLNAAGHHLHFIDSSGTTGGHVLDFAAVDLRVEVDLCTRLTTDIPETELFLNAPLD